MYKITCKYLGVDIEWIPDNKERFNSWIDACLYLYQYDFEHLFYKNTIQNIKIEKGQSDYPEPLDWKPPYGQIAKLAFHLRTEHELKECSAG